MLKPRSTISEPLVRKGIKAPVCPSGKIDSHMSLRDYLVPDYALPNPADQDDRKPEHDDMPKGDSLEQLIHQNSRILNKKLEIISSEIWWRLRIASQNLDSVDRDKALVRQMLQRLDSAALYQIREHQDKTILYRKLFDLQTEARSEQVQCWRDVATVMRDFLYVWEALEHARARARFIENA